MTAVEVHAPLAPSSAPQWANCSGSVMANAHVPDSEAPRTRAGTASHWVCSEGLEQFKLNGLNSCAADDWIGKVAPNGVVIDDEMAQGAQVFIDNASEIIERHDALQLILVEQVVKMPHIHPQNYGTLDLAIPLLEYERVNENVDRVRCGKIYLLDYKFGHRECRAFGNYQLIDYLEGLVDMYGIDTEAEQFIEVEFQIVQPFCYQARDKISIWKESIANLRGYVNQMIAKAQEAFNKPSFSSGPWCRDCKAIHRCQTAQKGNYSLIDYVNDPCVILNMNGSDLATERAILEQGLIVAKARKEALDEELKHRIGKGEAADSGLALEAAYGNLGWDVPKGQAIALASMFKVDANKADILTPTQTIAKASKEMKPLLKQAMKNISSRPPKGLKLIEAKDSFTARAFTSK